ncbi:MAG: metal-dependent hydrolase [Phototrophicales bacterium]|nr:MAG: metal-dependent hydrolase [Phototrophicales bacterium]RMG74131.1 MAG: DUF664 domain-containing protein [Chloroflexota bacterium]
MPTPEERQKLIKKIRQFPSRLRQAVQDLSPEQLTTRVDPHEWTIAQIVHHLADAHMNAYYRFKRILLEDNPHIPPFDQDLWATTPEATKAELHDSLTLLAGLHHHWAYLMENIPDTDWLRPAHHRQIGDVILYDVLYSYAQHGEEHLEQIQAIRHAGAF